MKVSKEVFSRSELWCLFLYPIGTLGKLVNYVSNLNACIKEIGEEAEK